jgi:hypothetical protein
MVRIPRRNPFAPIKQRLCLCSEIFLLRKKSEVADAVKYSLREREIRLRG